MFYFSNSSLKKLKTVDKKLQILFTEAIADSPLDFKITEGIRTLERQRELLRLGFSKTLKSYHLVGKAVDIAIIKNDEANWEVENYKLVANHIKKVAERLNIKIKWGGDFKSFFDGCHFQLED